MPPVLLDARQLAAKLDATYEEVLTWTRRGLIPVIKASGRNYYNLTQVARALNAQAEVAPSGQGADQ